MTDAPLDLRIVNGQPTPAELAAVTAVIHGILDELAEDEATRARATTTAWQRSQRSLRETLRPGAGAWRGFSG
jgi:gamma-glutamyl:cysteine ligase YbdK (ATP-grasp superfamily)